jgi:hypothetical protein
MAAQLEAETETKNSRRLTPCKKKRNKYLKKTA